MNSDLLATQTRIPPLVGQLINRPRLLEALELDLPYCKLVLVAAPAGYGKTTLLSQWAHTSKFPAAWISLSAAENDGERFFRYFFRAWEQIKPDIRESALGIKLEGRIPDSTSLLSALIQLASELPGHTAFVLDDFHFINEPSIHKSLTYLLDHLPGNAHIVLSTRSNPVLPVARYRARAELLELRMGDLQFNREETGAFLNQSMKLQLSSRDLENLQIQLEGWPAGLRLAALSIRMHQIGLPRPLITGEHRFVADYLSQDVLANLPEDLRKFLIQTSILDRLSASLCNAVTLQCDGQTMLETLERENLFLVPLDDNRHWYRYHRSFAEYLQAELSRQSPEQVPELHSRAARWFLENDYPEQAYSHALAAGDLEQMVVLFNRYANAKIQAGELTDLKRWLAALPEDWFTAYPALGLARAGYMAFTGAFEECLRVIDEIEKTLMLAQTENVSEQLARVHAVRCFIACTVNDLSQAELFADQALQDLPEEDVGFRPGIYAALGDTYRRNGLWEKARLSYQQALDFTNAPAIQVSSAHIYGALADLDLYQGRLHSASRYWSKALESIKERENWGRLPLPVTGWIYIRRAELLYEWNELAEAADHLERGLERAKLGGDIRAQIAGKILEARLSLVQGDLDAAEKTLAQAHALVEQAPFPEWAERLERLQVELWLAQNRLRTAVEWSESFAESGGLHDRPESDITRLALARVWIVKGDQQTINRSLKLLDSTFNVAQDGGWVGIAIETLALHAVARWQLGDLSGALATLENALRTAEPEGYIRLFVDLGPPMARLLQEAHGRFVLQSYTQKLLEAFGSDLSSPTSLLQRLPQPLTLRELEILNLVAAGLSNREIGESLVISPETVKKHVAHVIRKLGASNRIESVALARSLGLLK
jgi:LuxR family transcriptional regulator, maltose regulon positive regulatory protein